MASKYFSESELMCHGASQGDCNCGEETAANVNQLLLDKLDELRGNVGGPLSLSCAYRCPDHNAAVGGVSNSQHVQGNAADVLCPDYLTFDQFQWYVEQIGFDGIGLYPDSGFIHVDVRDGGSSPGAYRWNG